MGGFFVISGYVSAYTSTKLGALGVEEKKVRFGRERDLGQGRRTLKHKRDINQHKKKEEAKKAIWDLFYLGAIYIRRGSNTFFLPQTHQVQGL